MYIPPGVASSTPIPSALWRPGAPSHEEGPLRILSAAGDLLRRAVTATSPAQLQLQARDDPSVQSLNTTIGVVVGVILGVFIIGLLAFCWFFRFSIRFTYRKKRHRKSSKSSKSSRSSGSGSDGGGGAPPPPPPPPAA